MSVSLKPRYAPATNRQRGQAMLLTVLLLVVGVAALVYNFLTPAKQSIEKDRQTTIVLAQAKEALIGFAAGVDVTPACTGSNCPRIGDLPCPDLDNDGSAEGSCGDVAGTTGQAQRLGRLPWRTLGLPDPRDGNGERLWYAVSHNFKNNFRTDCSTSDLPTCRNSDSRGTITVRDRNGTVINNGNDTWGSFNPSGIIAVIIAPGAVLQRQGAASPQDRSCAVGVNCTAAEQCTTSPASLTPKCNPVNYLDILSGTEDNADFVDVSSTNGFINGDVLDASRNVIVNDRLIAITYQDLMPLLERRVAKEALNCLNAYAALPQNGGPTRGRYPWAAPASGYPSYADQSGVRFGRLPDGPFGATFLGIGGPVAVLVCNDILLPSPLCMRTSWPTSCSLATGTWWNNWKEMVLYGVAQAYQPADPASTLLGVPPGGPCGSCLTVDPPSSSADKRVVVIVAGKRLSAAAYPAGNGQPRNSTAYKQDGTNYLEEANDGSTTQNFYTQQPTSSSFNDVLLYQQ